jgi:hypothetical protein
MWIGGGLDNFQKLLALRDAIIIRGNDLHIDIEAARAALRAERDPERSALQRAALERLREQIALEQHGAVAREFDAAHSVERALAVGSLDRIVAVADLRRYIIDRLDADSNH